MTKQVRMKISDTQLLPQSLEVPFKVPNGDLRILIRAEQVSAGERNAHPAFGMPPETLPQLLTEGYEPLFSTFTTYLNDQVVKVKLFFRKSKHLTRSKSGVKNGKRHKMSTRQILTRAGFKHTKAVYDLVTKRR